MQDKILYRNEWYTIAEYYNGYVMLEDELGNQFEVSDNNIQAPAVKLCYA